MNEIEISSIDTSAANLATSQIIFLQTSDAIKYRPMLDITSETVKEYCRRHGLACEIFVGIVRGYHPWHATYNRIPMLRKWLCSGFGGWACYLDADAVIADLDFDLRGYLAEHADAALILGPGGPPRVWWNVNAGVFLLNFGHPIGQAIARGWAERFDAISDSELRNAEAWSSVPDDQSLLWETLQSVPGAEHHVLIETEEPRLLNYDGRFIKQVLRAKGDFGERLTRLRALTAQILGSPDWGLTSDRHVHAIHEEFASALYRVLLLREPDPPGLADAAKRLREGFPLEDALRSCVRCPEFMYKWPRFIRTHVDPSFRAEAATITDFSLAGNPQPDTNVRPSSPAVKPIVYESNQVTLTALANKWGSDKGTKVGSPPHKYTYIYDLIFFPYRFEQINLLEIGLAIGGPEIGGPVERRVQSPSVQMWLEYFPNATIFGFDISDFSHLEQPRFRFVRGDCGAAADLERLAGSAPQFDIIIDDASHASFHQQLAFLYLYPRLAPGGLYVIEDLHWQSPEYEQCLPQVPETGRFFLSYFEDHAYIPNLLFSEEHMCQIADAMASFSCFPSFDRSASPIKMIVLRKQLNDREKLDGQ